MPPTAGGLSRLLSPQARLGSPRTAAGNRRPSLAPAQPDQPPRHPQEPGPTPATTADTRKPSAPTLSTVPAAHTYSQPVPGCRDAAEPAQYPQAPAQMAPEPAGPALCQGLKASPTRAGVGGAATEPAAGSFGDQPCLPGWRGTGYSSFGASFPPVTSWWFNKACSRAYVLITSHSVCFSK